MISVLTPVHPASLPFIEEAYQSLAKQTNKGWEWVLVLNCGVQTIDLPSLFCGDSRIKPFVIEDDDPSKKHNRIGRLKGFAAEMAQGDILVELDADDLLTPNALSIIQKTFDDPGTVMAYSNSAEFQNKTWKGGTYSEYYGWQSRPFSYKTHDLIETIAWPPSPHMMRSVLWAPNHVRAWRTVAYRKMGGHNATIKTGDDHELCCRFYAQYGTSGIKHIDRCLYLYRRHDNNSCQTHNGEVHAQVLQNYLQYSRAMAIRWAKDSNYELVDLGGRLNSWPEFKTVDLFDADIIADLNGVWPFEDNSIGVLRASHVFEHLFDPVHTMNEAYRVLAPGGWLFIDVPSTDGRGAFQDPTHVSFWNENSVWYYTDRNYSRFIPEFNGRFQNARTVTFFPSEFEKQHNIPIVQADLIALKPPYDTRPVGEIRI